MPPKKAPEEKKVLLGRPKGHLKMGIVGLPNVGKSTLFNTLSKLSVPAENYPFCTIEPNVSRIVVPDERYDWLCQLYKPRSEVPPYLEIVDIAGLVRGASTGEGLGNAFLSHIRAVDGLYQVVRIFEDNDITHVEGNIDPIRDLEIINKELLLKDIQFLTDYIKSTEKLIRADKTRKAELEFLFKLDDWIRVQEKPVRFGAWKTNEIEWLNPLQLLTAKTSVYLINMSESDYARKKSKWLAPLKKWIDDFSQNSEVIIPFCGALEANLQTIPEEQRIAYCKEKSIQSAIPKVIKLGYTCINLIHFFTCGEDEVKCWTIRKLTKAPQAAGTIHTDFEQGFICADVMRYEDLHELGSEAACKAGGKYTQQGKNYTVEDGDICYFKFNVTTKKK